MIKALTLKNAGDLELSQYEIPENCEDGIILDIIACGICGTDGHLIDGKMSLDYPIIPGHEFYGKISYIGKNSKVTSLNGDIKIGDIVSAMPGKSCGKCIYCQSIADAEELCTNRKCYGISFNVNKMPHLGGGYAEKVYLNGDFNVYHISKDWPMGFGAILETIAVGVNAVDRTLQKTCPADNRKMTAVIIGAGAVGVSVALAFMKKGVEVSIIEPVKARRDLAKELGAKNIYDKYILSDDWENRFADDFGGLKPDIVVESAGSLEAFEAAMRLVRRGGSVLELGNFVDVGEISFKPSYICRNEITIIGSQLAPEHCFEEAVEILNNLTDKADKIISPSFKLEEYEEAIDNLKHKKEGLKAVFVMEAKND